MTLVIKRHINLKRTIMTAVLLIGWVVIIGVSYKAAVVVLEKTGNL